MARFTRLAAAHRDDTGSRVEIGRSHRSKFGVPTTCKQSTTDKLPKCRFASIDDAHALGFREIVHARCLNPLKGFHTAPSVITCDMTSLPRVIESSFQDSQD